MRVPWAEKALSMTAWLPSGPLDVHVVHVPPGSSNGWVKVEVLEALYHHLACESARPRLLCGDFNTPQAELPSGEVVTWGQRIDEAGRVRPRRVVRGRPAAQWDAAERNVLTGLAAFGLRDVFRSLHGYQVPAASWVLRYRTRVIPRRFDHIFASPHILAVRCDYLHEWRKAGLSDHAAIEADLEVATEEKEWDKEGHLGRAETGSPLPQEVTRFLGP